MITTHNFDEYVERKNTDSYKWNCEFTDIDFPMGCADMDFKCPQPVIDALKNHIDNGVLAYSGYHCVKDMQQSIAAYYERRHNTKVKPEDIIYTSGLMVAFNMMIEAFASPGDKVILQTPVYHSFKKTIESAGLFVIENNLLFDEDTLSYSIDFDGLASCAADPRTRLMMLCNPMNPVGKRISVEELQRIYEICRDNNVLLISDEVHGDLYYNGLTHNPLHSVSEECRDNTIMMSASGKTFNLASFWGSYIVIPNKNLRDVYQVTMERHHADINDLAVIANAVAYRDCDYYIEGLKEYLGDNLNYLRHFLQVNDIGIKLIEPEATYLAWLDFRGWKLNSDHIQELLLTYGVGLATGSKFGSKSDGFMRMNFACHRSTLINALEAIKQAHKSI
ncbi:MalY/PatB family protein [Escherichia coli]|uniref:MalY/PatB family protein n=1 Tax=Escherichia coli TaxID=562 RepID=UPI003B37D98E